MHTFVIPNGTCGVLLALSVGQVSNFKLKVPFGITHVTHAVRLLFCSHAKLYILGFEVERLVLVEDESYISF